MVKDFWAKSVMALEQMMSAMTFMGMIGDSAGCFWRRVKPSTSGGASGVLNLGNGSWVVNLGKGAWGSNVL